MNPCYKFFLPFTLLLISFSSYGQKSFKLKDGSRLELSENNYATYYYADGGKMSEGKMVNGKREGKWKFYKGYEKPYAIEHYENGLMHGDAKYYFIGTEIIKSVGAYNSNKRNGEWKYYTSHKEQIHVIVNFSEGILNGPAIYYDTIFGYKVSQGSHLNGKRQGEWKFYAHRTGKLHGIENYKDGLMEGIASYYDTINNCEKPACMKVADGQYEQNLRTGLWKLYDSKYGKLISEETYNRGKIYGHCKVYSPITFNKIIEGDYIDMKGEGKIIYYFDDHRTAIKTMSIMKEDEYDGLVQTYDSVTLKLIGVYTYKMGLLHGHSAKYTVSGSTIDSFNYINGELSGLGIIYDTTCNKRISEGIFENGQLNGLFRKYYKCSNQTRFEVYMKNGKLHGSAVYYDSLTGIVNEEGSHFEDMQKGEWKYYYSGSKILKSKLNYKDDLPEGHAYYYDSSTGDLVSEGKFDNGVREGKWISYYVPSGKIASEEQFFKGELDGEYILYDTTGKVFLKMNYENGKRNGIAEEYYYGTGKKWIVSNSENDSLHGILKTFYPTGELKREEQYVRGRLIKAKCYNPNGDSTDYYPVRIDAKFEEDVMTYIGRKLQYPEDAREKKKQGKVTVRFKINETGMVSDAEIIKSAGHGMDEEALRIITEMPPWQPAYLDGLPYSSQKTLPIVFWLPETE